MAIVRAVAEAHGGSASIVPGDGATVRMWLPQDAVPAARARSDRGRRLTSRAASQTGLTFGPYGARPCPSLCSPWSPRSPASPVALAPPALPQGGEPVTLDPADFTTRIDNRYWPMRPGSRWVYRERGENGRTQRVTVTVTHRTRKVAGVRARIVHDVVTQGGRLVEDTFDWYAQDRAGNVWYLGEDTTEHQDGGSTREGSWEAGVDGAQAGVIMAGRPARRAALPPGVLRRARRGPAPRSASLHGRAVVPFGRFSDVLVTRDSNPLTKARRSTSTTRRASGRCSGCPAGGAARSW